MIPRQKIVTFLAELELLGQAARKLAFAAEVRQAGGYYDPPKGGQWDSHLFEIQLHQVSAQGFCEDEAIRNWMKAAKAVCGTAPARFGAPRNHFEEIENLRASTKPRVAM